MNIFVKKKHESHMIALENEDIRILPIIFRLMQGQILPLDQCQDAFFREAIKDGILIVNKTDRTIKAKIIEENRYNYARDKYGHTLLNFLCRFFDDHENNLLIRYWELLQAPNIPLRDEEPIIHLNEKDKNLIVLLGRVKYIQEGSSWFGTKGTALSIETRIKYTNLSDIVCEDNIYTECIIPGKEYQNVEKEIKENSIVAINGTFRPEKGSYRFFEEDVNVIVNDYVVIGNDISMDPENGDDSFFIERSETDSNRYLNKVVLTGVISNIGFKVTRGYPHMTLYLRTRIDNDKEEYLEIPVDIWEKHHKDCFKDLNIGKSICVEGYFKHPISKRYYYSYESIDAAVYAFKYKVLNNDG